MTRIYIYTTTFILASAVCRAFAEIAKWRPGWSWLPLWLFEYRGAYNIDPYHIISNAHWVFIAIAAGIYCRNVPQIAWYALPVAWALHGVFHDAFYHYFFMAAGYWGR